MFYYAVKLTNGISIKNSFVFGNNNPKATNNPNKQPEAPKTMCFDISKF